MTSSLISIIRNFRPGRPVGPSGTVVGELGVDDPTAESQGDDLDQGTEKFGGAGAVESEFLVDGVSQCGLDPTAEDVEVVGVAEVWGSVERHADDSCEGLVGCLTFLVYPKHRSGYTWREK